MRPLGVRRVELALRLGMLNEPKAAANNHTDPNVCGQGNAVFVIQLFRT